MNGISSEIGHYFLNGGARESKSGKDISIRIYLVPKSFHHTELDGGVNLYPPGIRLKINYF